MPSMTRIDFYTGASDRLQTAIRLVLKAREQQKRVFVFTDGASTSDELDRRLWTFQQLSFVPHCRADDALAGQTPVIIDHQYKNLPHTEILINLHPECPPFFRQFERLLEIVGDDEEQKSQARQRFRSYRDDGYPPQTIALGQARNN